MNYEKRLESFEHWPIQIAKPTKEELAAAGFYYTGIADIVVCHCCKLKLKGWIPTDSAIHEHKKWIAELKLVCPFSETIVDETESSDDEDLDKSKTESSDDIRCKICYINKISSVLIPCRHSFCKRCGRKLEQCPFCSSQILIVGKLYLN